MNTHTILTTHMRSAWVAYIAEIGISSVGITEGDAIVGVCEALRTHLIPISEEPPPEPVAGNYPPPESRWPEKPQTPYGFHWERQPMDGKYEDGIRSISLMDDPVRWDQSPSSSWTNTVVFYAVEDTTEEVVAHEPQAPLPLTDEPQETPFKVGWVYRTKSGQLAEIDTMEKNPSAFSGKVDGAGWYRWDLDGKNPIPHLDLLPPAGEKKGETAVCMNFMEAVNAMEKGNRCRRPHWSSNIRASVETDGLFRIRASGQPIGISAGDLRAEDWQCV